MIVEPVPTATRSRRRRAVARAALVVPVALLLVVIAAGVLGRTTAPVPVPSAPIVARIVAASPSASPGFVTIDPPRPTSRPTVIDGMPVRSVSDVLARTAAGTRPPSTQLLAVAGYVGVPNPPATCDDSTAGALDPLGVLGPLCNRPALMALVPWSLAGSEGFAGIGAHLHLRVPVGVRLPDGIERTTMQASGGPLEVVVVGSLDTVPADGCLRIDVECDVRLQLDDVAWVEDGASTGQPVVGPGIDPRVAAQLLPGLVEVERAALGDGGKTYVAALVRTQSLARFDADAAAAIRHAPPRQGLVLYVRGITATALEQARPALAWAVADVTTLELLASGVTGPRAYAPFP
jgi:hypothetical protein